MRLRRNNSVLVVIDVQDRLIDTIADHANVVNNIKALVRTAAILKMPMLVTEQEKLGETVPELKALLINSPRFQKLSFSCCADSAFMDGLRQQGMKAVLACGIETHICVEQTVLDLLDHHYDVLVAGDATSSNTVTDRETAIERMKSAGAVISSTEAVIYELTESAGTEGFRRILEVVKDRRAAIVP